jgi:hypothetical protein
MGSGNAQPTTRRVDDAAVTIRYHGHTEAASVGVLIIKGKRSAPASALFSLEIKRGIKRTMWPITYHPEMAAYAGEFNRSTHTF